MGCCERDNESACSINGNFLTSCSFAQRTRRQIQPLGKVGWCDVLRKYRGTNCRSTALTCSTASGLTAEWCSDVQSGRTAHGLVARHAGRNSANPGSYGPQSGLTARMVRFVSKRSEVIFAGVFVLLRWRSKASVSRAASSYTLRALRETKKLIVGCGSICCCGNEVLVLKGLCFCSFWLILVVPCWISAHSEQVTLFLQLPAKSVVVVWAELNCGGLSMLSLVGVTPVSNHPKRALKSPVPSPQTSWKNVEGKKIKPG